MSRPLPAMSETRNPPPPGPMLRRGPRPLLLHLTLNLAPKQSSQASGTRSASSDAASSSSNPSPDQSAPQPDASQAARLDAALREAGLPDAALITGIAAYRRHPYRRALADPPSLWRHGDARLLDFGPQDGIPALFVPSLINRGSILDLMAQASMLRWLAARGIRTMLLEWGWPGPIERGFGVGDYITQRLEPALQAAASQCGRKIVLIGYCMGGLLAVASALRRPDLVAALGLIATPWDFHAGGGQAGAEMAALPRQFDSVMAATGTLPIDAIQLAFARTDPAAIARKYREFGASDQSTERARLFVAIEDWVNDGVPLAAPVALECLQGWYGENLPARGLWRVAGEPVRPETLEMPSFAVMPQRDRIVPPQSAAALAACIRHATALSLPGGHVSLVAGPRASRLLWEPLLAWLREQPAPRRRKRACVASSGGAR